MARAKKTLGTEGPHTLADMFRKLLVETGGVAGALKWFDVREALALDARNPSRARSVAATSDAFKVWLISEGTDVPCAS